MAGSVFAGVISALLGVGGGLVKVPLMNLAMGVPLRVSTATSNLMMGITATASAVIYLLRDEIDPYIAGPMALGVFVGATAGSRLAHRIDLRVLRLLFVVVLLVDGLADGHAGARPVTRRRASGSGAATPPTRSRRTIARLLVAGHLARDGPVVVGVVLMLAGGHRPARPRRDPAVRPRADPCRDRCARAGGLPVAGIVLVIAPAARPGRRRGRRASSRRATRGSR